MRKKEAILNNNKIIEESFLKNIRVRAEAEPSKSYIVINVTYNLTAINFTV